MVRLFDMDLFRGSQVNMDSEGFDDEIVEDAGFEPEIDEICIDPPPEIAMFCVNGYFLPYYVDDDDLFNESGGGGGGVDESCTDQSTLEYGEFICEYYTKFPSTNESLKTETLYQLSTGMDNRFVEPWLRCKVRQSFNDGLRGNIDGQLTTINVFKGAQSQWVRASPLSLFGIFTDRCYFLPTYSEIVA